MKKFTLLFILMLSIRFISNAQDIEIKRDSLVLQGSDSLTIPTILKDSLSNAFNLDKKLPEMPAIPFLLPDHQMVAFDTKYTPPPALIYFEDDYLVTTPFNSSYIGNFESGWMGGINNHMKFTDNFWMNVNIFATSTNMWPMLDMYKNASISMDMKWQVHERIRLVGFGEISLREGLDPMRNPMINGGNYFGGGVEFKITKGFGIGFGFSSTLYDKQWTTRPYAVPVAW